MKKKDLPFGKINEQRRFIQKARSVAVQEARANRAYGGISFMVAESCRAGYKRRKEMSFKIFVCKVCEECIEYYHYENTKEPEICDRCFQEKGEKR